MKQNKSKSWERPLAIGYATALSIFLIVTNVHPDTADHWVWSQKLFLSYYEHPPMIAWWIRLGATLIPTTPDNALKIITLLTTGGVLALCYGWARDIYNREVACWMLAILMLMPYFFPAGIFLSVNMIMLVWYISSLWLLTHAMKYNKPHYLLFIGITAGLGGLSKYIFILLAPSVLISLATHKDNRRWLRHPYLYTIPFIALLLFSPVLFWNTQNAFVSFTYQLSKGIGGNGLEKLMLFSLGALLLFSPPLTLIGLYVAKKNKGIPVDGITHLIRIISIVPIVIFSISSLTGHISDSNWLDISYIPIALLVARFCATHRPIGRILIATMATLSFALMMTIIFILNTPSETIVRKSLSERMIYSMLYWEETANAIELLLKEKGGIVPAYVLGNEGYQNTAMLSLYMPSHPLPYATFKAERNQWVRSINELKEKGFFMVCRPSLCAQAQAEIKDIFPTMQEESIGDVKTITPKGRWLRHLYIYRYALPKP